MKNNRYTDMLAAYGVTAARPGGNNITNYILSKHSIQPNSQVLEIGCGIGDTAKKIASQYNTQVTAIDIHSKMIEKAKIRHGKIDNITWKCGDINTIDLPKGAFDTVILESVLSFTPLKKTLERIHRLLKENGTLLLLEPIYLGGLPEEDFNGYKTFYGFNSILTEEKWRTILLYTGFFVENFFKSYEMDLTPEEMQFPELVMDNKLDEIHVNTLQQHEEFTEKFLAYFDYAYIISKKR